MYGNNVIQGEGDFSNQRMRIWFKNENHVTWIDERPHVTSPDLIAMVHAETGDPITNTVAAKGMTGRCPGHESP